MTDILTRTLGEICDEVNGIIQTGPFGSQLHQSDYQKKGTPVIMPRDLVMGKVSTDNIARIGTRDVKRLSRHILGKGDIVYARRGDIGRRALITSREAGWLCGTGCMRISIEETVLNPVFLYYYLGQPNVVTWIYNQAVGATMPNLNTSIIRSIPIAYPPLPTQQRIAGILSAYDNLIENNTRRIAILEEIAQHIYREWFIHYRFPGHEHTQFVDTELGQIPQGWEVKTIPEAVEINPRLRIPKERDKPYLSMKSLSETSMLITNIGSRSGNSGSKFQNGDTLFARITPCLENGKTGFVQFLPPDDAVGLGSTEFIVLRSRTLLPEYVYLLARTDDFRAHAIKSMTGASGRQRVQVVCFDEYHIAQPDQETLIRFIEQVRPIFKAVHLLTQKNANLRQTRDLLLPRLVSGKIKI